MPNPAKNDPSEMSSPTYTAVCTPMRGRTSGVYKVARVRCMARTTGRVMRRGVFDFDVWSVGVIVRDGFESAASGRS